MRRHGRRQRERGGAARPGGRRAVEGQGGAGPRGTPVPPHVAACALFLVCVFSPCAPRSALLVRRRRRHAINARSDALRRAYHAPSTARGSGPQGCRRADIYRVLAHTFQALVFKQHPDPGEWARPPLTDRLVPRPCLRRDRMVAPVCERRGPAERGS